MDSDAAATIIALVLFVILFVIQVFFQGFRSAAEHIHNVDLEEIPKEEDKQRIEEILDREVPTRHAYYIYTSLFPAICGIYFWALFLPLLIQATGQTEGVSMYLLTIAGFVVYFFLIAVLGIFVPIKIGERKADHWLIRNAGIVSVIMAVLKPFTVVVNGTSNLLLPLFHADPHQSVDDITEDELISMIDESHEQGMILESEAEMIHNIFEFDDKDAFDIMTPRSNICAFPSDMKFEDAFDVMLTENFSRFPVYEEDVDHITGIMHIKDAMLLSRHEDYLRREIRRVPGLVHEIEAVPETQNINQLLRMMQKSKEHMALVVDEYGQTAGIVTLEDILEEIVGEIEDEHDEEIAMVLAQSNGNYLLNGLAELDEVSEKLGITFDVDDINTLNGFLITKIDKIPEDNETFSVTYGGFEFRVLSVSGKMIKTVLAAPVAADAEEIKEERG